MKRNKMVSASCQQCFNFQVIGHPNFRLGSKPVNAAKKSIESNPRFGRIPEERLNAVGPLGFQLSFRLGQFLASVSA
jgi:hypothetical protein